MPVMEPDQLLAASRSALRAASHRLTDLIRPLPDLEQPIPDSEWTAREAVAHLVTALDLYTEIATGTPSPISACTPAAFAEDARRRIADVSETDPAKLAYLLGDAADRFVSAVTGPTGDTVVTWHAGVELSLAELAGLMVGEMVLHGYDIAVACRRPWPLQADEVALILTAFGPHVGRTVDVEGTRELTVTFSVELRGVVSFVVRFDNGCYSLEPDGWGPVDCAISADPAAFLLVTSERMPRWPAIALGLYEAGGNRPELAFGFKDLFVFP
jgi:uncharacterized protein (TIGR03083 family)